MKTLAIIPARGGSKGLPRKNIKLLAGKPLIVWTIEQAKRSKYIDKIIVSTEDREIAEVARKYGGEVPFLRPEELTKDETSQLEVVLHAINWLEKRNENFDIIVLLEPTSPLRDTGDIDKCLELLLSNKKAKAVVSIVKLEGAHPEFNSVLNNEGFIRKLDGTANYKGGLRRQELEDIYCFEGSVYLSYVDTFKERKTFYHNLTLGYVVPRWKSHEVDDIHDFICVEAIKNEKRNKSLE